MRDCVKLANAKNSCRLLVGALLTVSWLLITPAVADDFAASVKTVELVTREQAIVLQAQLNLPLSPSAKQALMNGVPLFWDITLSITQHRPLWWDKTLLVKRLRYQIRYYALLNVYRVKEEDSQKTYNFASLTAAMGAISQLNAVKLIKQSQLETRSSYRLQINITFDREGLPIPLRAIAYFDSQWSLSSAKNISFPLAPTQ